MNEHANGNALVVAAIDGLATLECGVGTVVDWFFECVDDIAAAVPSLRARPWSLYAISPKVSVTSPDYSPDQHQSITTTCAAHGGQFRWLDNTNSAGLGDMWSHDDPAQWERMCALLAAEVVELCQRHEKVTVLVHGVMLANVRAHAPSVANLQIIYITHSLGRAFTDATSKARMAMDTRAFAAMGQNPLDRVGYIGTYFRDLLREEYGLKHDKLTPFVNAVPRRRRVNLPDEQAGREHLRRVGVPDGRRLIFSWGRCHPQKGFDVLIPAFYQFLQRPGNNDWHLVVLMPQGLTDPRYRRTITDLLAAGPLGSVTAVTTFDQQLPLHMLRNHALEIVAFASRFEGAPLSVLETLAFARPGVRAVWNDTPSLAQFLAGRPGAVSSPKSGADELAEALETAAAMPTGIGVGHIETFEETAAYGLRDVLSWWD